MSADGVEDAPAFLALDAGTTGVKVCTVDAVGRVLAGAYRGYPCSHPRPGWVEQDVDALYDAAIDAVCEVVATTDAPIVAVACSAQRATWVPMGRAGEALTRYIGWQDNRGLADCTRIHRIIDPQEYTDRTGMVLDTIASVSKIGWYLREAASPDLACLGAHQTLLLRQLGAAENVVSPSEASYMGLLDVRSRAWDADLAAALGIDAGLLPRVVESGTRVGGLSPRTAERTGLPPGLPLVMGGGDLQLGVLGVGALSRGVVAVGIGTGGGCVSSFQQPHVDPRGRLNCLAHTAPGWWEVEGLASAAGGAFRWFKDTFGAQEEQRAAADGLDVYDLLTAQVGDEPTDLLVIPALAGLGAPHLDPRFSGMIMGLRLDHSRGQVIRAFMEGVALEQRTILDTIIETTEPVREIRVWGGAAKSDVWCQIQSDVYELPVSRCRQADASVLGAAICAAAGVGAVDTVPQGSRQMTGIARTWTPSSERSDAYRRLRSLYDDAVSSMREADIGERLFDLRHQGMPSQIWAEGPTHQRQEMS